MTQVIQLKAKYPKYRIKSIHMDNATGFSSQAFNDYLWLKEWKHNIMFHMFIHKMVW
jgi:hypothetical protein